MSDFITRHTIRTYTGRRLNPLSPDFRDIAIEDIAHALSMLCRFGGHASQFYSVAQHSVLMSYYVEGGPFTKMWALLHDASEGLGLVDIPRPAKYGPGMEAYREAEQRSMTAVAKRFGLPWYKPHGFPEEVRRVDDAILKDEANALLPHEEKQEGGLGIPIVPWKPREAERTFLCRYHELRDEIYGAKSVA
jgi:hypothetical protein